MRQCHAVAPASRRTSHYCAPGVNVLGFFVRFIAGGLIVALVPIVAEAFGPGVAGIAVLAPVVTVAGFIALSVSEGGRAVERAAGVAIVGMPAIAAYLIVFYLCQRYTGRFPIALSAGLLAWSAVAVPVAIVARARS
jgi:uncharacterized membrane protein (GlpM family)